MMQTRRRFLTTLTLAGGAGLAGMPRVLAAEPPPETTSVRVIRNPSICLAPQYVAEELLRAEGFTDVRYVTVPPRISFEEALGRGEADFSLNFALVQVQAIDAGVPITILAGVMVGCFELFASTAIRSLTELKGKSVVSRRAVRFAVPDGRASRARPDQGHPLGRRPRCQPARAFRGWQDRCLPRLSAGAAGAPRPARRPCHRQHRGGPPVVAVFLLSVGGQQGVCAQISGRDQTCGARHPQGSGSLRC